MSDFQNLTSAELAEALIEKGLKDNHEAYSSISMIVADLLIGFGEAIKSGLDKKKEDARKQYVSNYEEP